MSLQSCPAQGLRESVSSKSDGMQLHTVCIMDTQCFQNVSIYLHLFLLFKNRKLWEILVMYNNTETVE